MEHHEEVGLPGAVGSVDVVHVHWATCPAGDFNQSKGNKSYPLLAFQCITDLDRKILGVFGPQFGCQKISISLSLILMCTKLQMDGSQK